MSSPAVFIAWLIVTPGFLFSSSMYRLVDFRIRWRLGLTRLDQGDFLDDGEEDDDEEDDEDEDEEEEDEQEYSKVGTGIWGDEEVEFEVRCGPVRSFDLIGPRGPSGTRGAVAVWSVNSILLEYMYLVWRLFR